MVNLKQLLTLGLMGGEKKKPVEASKAPVTQKVETTSRKAKEVLEVAEPVFKERVTLRSEQVSPQSVVPFEDSLVVAPRTGGDILVIDKDGSREKQLADSRLSYEVNYNTNNFRDLGHRWQNYIIFFDKKYGTWLAYEVAEKNGEPRLPRNWKKFTPYDANYPSDLSDYIREFMATKVVAGFGKRVGKEYLCGATEDSICVWNAEGTPVWNDSLPGVGDNVCVDPAHPGIFYYCTSKGAKEIWRVDTNGPIDPPWKAIKIPFSKFCSIKDLQMHPSGEFFICKKDDVMTILYADTLTEVPCNALKDVRRVVIGADRNLYGGKRVSPNNFEEHHSGYQEQLLRIETNLDELAQYRAQKREANRLANISVEGALRRAKSEQTAPAQAAAPAEDFSAFQGDKTKYETQFQEYLSAAKTAENVDLVRRGLGNLRQELQQAGIRPGAIAFLTDDIEKAIGLRNQEMADEKVKTVLQTVRAQLAAGPLSMALIPDVRSSLSLDQSLEQALSPAVREQIARLRLDFGKQAGEFFRQHGNDIVKQMDGIVDAERSKLEKMTTQREFDEWQQQILPDRRQKLLDLEKLCTVDDSKAIEAITNARVGLIDLERTFEKKFREERDLIREGAYRQIEKTIGILKDRVEGFLDGIRNRGFASRADAEKFLKDNKTLQQLADEVTLLAEKNKDASKELLESLQVGIMNFLFAVQRGEKKTEGSDGRSMIKFGKVSFPRFEGQKRKLGKRRATLGFEPEEKTKGAGVKPDDLWGDVTMDITTADGHDVSMRLWQTAPPRYSEKARDEGDFRYGRFASRGQEIASSYRTQKDFRALRKLYAQWQSNGPLKKQHDALRAALEAHYDLRELPKQRTKKDTDWKKKHLTILQEFGTFSSQNQIPLVRRIDAIENAPDPEFQNGKGMVPQWENHWVVTPEDEEILEEMAGHFNMQLENREGILNLEGHAGTGKDVLLKIFASEQNANRPFFTYDCSKWSTEFDLSEEIVLESVNGASQTVGVPSIVLQAIQTPGAIMYFNEFNAMPQQAQIFLHALFDEKRSMTIKTRGGQTVKADKSVVFACSMNPGYPGTFDPQFATASRMVPLPVPYPPEKRKKDANDTLPGEPYSASEALKIARSVDSFRAMTLEPDMKRNAFVQLWDAYVNNIGPKPTLTKAMEFDLDVVIALVQFGNRLRADFVKLFEKTDDADRALPITQPLTLREMRRCAYVLSHMTEEEKINGNADVTAKQLLKKFFLRHIKSQKDREQIETAMTLWTLQKRATV